MYNVYRDTLKNRSKDASCRKPNGPAHDDASQARATVNIRLPLPRMLRPMTSVTGRAGHGSRQVGNKVETPLGAAG